MDRINPPPQAHPSLFDYITSAFNSWVRSILGIQSSHGTKIAELEAQIAAGAAFTDNFNRPDAPDLGNGWVQGGQGQYLGIIDYAARLNNSILGTAFGIRYAICPQVMSDDNHAVVAIVNPAGVAQSAFTSLFIRANSDMTQFVYANIYGGRMYMGRGTRAGNVWTFTDWVSRTDRGVSESDTVDLSCAGTKYTLRINNVPVLEHTDTSSYPIDGSHRYVGFASETRLVNFLPQFSWGLSGFTARNVLGVFAEIKSTAQDASNQALEAVNQVEALRAQLEENNGGEGNSWSYAFVGPDGPVDAAYWSGESTNEIYIEGNKAKIRNLGYNEQSWIRHVTPITSDDMSATVVLGDDETASGSRYTSIVIKSGPNLEDFAFCSIYRHEITIGHGRWVAGNASIITQWWTEARETKIGHTVEFSCVRIAGADTYQVKHNGYPIIAHTDGANAVPSGVGHRYVGLGMHRASALGFMLRSYAISRIAAKDISPLLKSGTGWSLYRGQGGGINCAGGGNFLLPTSAETFTATRDAIGVELNNRGRGIIKILRAGFYTVHVKLAWDTAAGTSAETRALIFQSDNPATLVMTRQGKENTGTRGWAASETFVVYCAANSYIAPGYYHTNAKNAVGDAAGTATYFDGALMR
jgi:hypothetical protein